METLPAIYTDETLAHRYREQLFVTDAWKPDAPLLPVSVLNGIVSEVDGFNAPIALTDLPTMIKALIGSYPARELNDAAIFTKALAGAVKEFSNPVLRKVFKETIKRKKFFPAVADVFLACEEEDRLVRLPKTYAKMQLKAHDQRGTIYTPEELEEIRARQKND